MIGIKNKTNRHFKHTVITLTNKSKRLKSFFLTFITFTFFFSLLLEESTLEILSSLTSSLLLSLSSSTSSTIIYSLSKNLILKI